MLKVLLIDDEQRATDALRLMIVKTIPEIGDIMVCNDARQGAEKIHSFQPGLVFLDIQMPHLNGFELLVTTSEGTITVRSPTSRIPADVTCSAVTADTASGTS